MYCYLIVKKLVLLFILISDALDKWDNFSVFRNVGSNNFSKSKRSYENEKLIFVASFFVTTRLFVFCYF